MYRVLWSEFSFFRGQRILLKTQGSPWDPDNSLYNSYTSDPHQTWSKCHTTPLKRWAVRHVQGQHVNTSAEFPVPRSQSGFVASLLLKRARERYRFDYSDVEQTQFIGPFTAYEHGDDYSQAETSLEVKAVTGHGNRLSQNSFYVIRNQKKRSQAFGKWPFF